MTWINFRETNGTTRLKMKLRDPHTLKQAEDAEIRFSGPIWIRREDFPGCLDHLPAEKPAKAGQMIKSARK